MQDNDGRQLSQLLDQSRPGAVIEEVERLFALWYGGGAFDVVRHVAAWTERLFAGTFPGYRACNTEYHDLGHTMDVFLAAARLIDGHNVVEGPLAEDLAADLLVAALLHDTGYIQEAGDAAGTGAKYTCTHVERSASFAEKHAELLQIGTPRVQIVRRLISVTNLDNARGDAGFADESEKTAGSLLATADLLAQMADRYYLEKLLFLYRELKEAGVGEYETEFDLLRKTLGFYTLMRKRLDGPLGRVYTLAAAHFEKRFGIPRNLYIESIERQMEYLKTIIADDSSNFRKKLKRLDLERLENGRPARPA